MFKILLLLIPFLAGCTSGRVSINSVPEKSEVVVVNSSGKQRSLGTTPIVVEAATLFQPGDNSTKLIVQKTGMYRESIVIPRSVLKNHHQISVTLSELEKVEIEKIIGEDCKKHSENFGNTRGDFSKLAQGVANIQSLLVKKDYATAESQLTALIATYPFVSVLHALLGNSRFLQRDYAAAGNAYKRALELDPDNIETKNILNRIASFTGNSSTSSEEN